MHHATGVDLHIVPTSIRAVVEGWIASLSSHVTACFNPKAPKKGPIYITSPVTFFFCLIPMLKIRYDFSEHPVRKLFKRRRPTHTAGRSCYCFLQGRIQKGSENRCQTGLPPSLLHLKYGMHKLLCLGFLKPLPKCGALEQTLTSPRSASSSRTERVLISSHLVNHFCFANTGHRKFLV